MVEQIRAKITHHRQKIVPGIVALSLLSGLIVSIVSTPNALADYYTGCGYGYNSSAGGFGYGTGVGYGYGYLNGVFGYGYGNEVCPPAPTTTTTTTPVTTTTAHGGTTTTSTTTTTSVTTTTSPVTTTTVARHHGRAPLFCKKDHEYAVVGRTVKNAITGGGFYGKPKITSDELGTNVAVIHDYGNLLIAKVTVRHGSQLGWHTLKITVADGRFCKVNYQVK